MASFPHTEPARNEAELIAPEDCSYSRFSLEQSSFLTQSKWFREACVASPHYLASAAGLEILASGGNALDAAIATNLTLGVVTPYLCGYGGDLFALVWKDGVFAYNGSGRAPAAATPERIREAAGDEMQTFGPLTVTVPGAVEAWFSLLQRFGSRSFRDIARTALRLATEGFVVSRHAAASFTAARERYREFDEWQKVYGAVRESTLLRQPDLARSIEALCERGPEAFYRGPIADAMAEHLQSVGGILTKDDLAGHTGEWVQPLGAGYRGVEVLELPPNTQGVAALEALKIVEHSEPLPPDGAERQHLLIEATKLALADRDMYVTDPEAMTVDPRELLSAEWARDRFESIDPHRAGTPSPSRALRGGTAYMCAADSTGMLVSLIQSNWMGFGSGVTVPGWGINLHNRGNYFSLDADHANVIAPRKRTLHTLVPAMALRDGRPWLVFGAMGGDGQPQTHLQFLARRVDDGRDIQETVSAPRWLVSPSDWSVSAESRFDRSTLEGLRDRGHDVSVTEPFDSGMGHAHAIEVAEDGYLGATDPRAEGAVLGM